MKPTYSGSSDYSEPESAAVQATEPAASTAPAEDATRAPKPSATRRHAAPVDLAAAAALAHPEPRTASADGRTPVQVAAAPADDRAGTDGALPWAVLVVASLVLLAVTAVAVRRWYRHRRRGQLEAMWERRQADWDAAVSQIRLERTPGPTAGH